MSASKQPKIKTRATVASEDQPKPQQLQTEPQQSSLKYDITSFDKILKKVSNDIARGNFENIKNEPPIVSSQGSNLKPLEGNKDLYELRAINTASRMFFLRKNDTFYALSSTNNHQVQNNVLKELAKRKSNELNERERS